MGRYFAIMNQLEDHADDYKELEASCEDIWRVPKHCAWITIGVSSFFLGFILFDLTSVEVGEPLSFVFLAPSILFIFTLCATAKLG